MQYSHLLVNELDFGSEARLAPSVVSLCYQKRQIHFLQCLGSLRDPIFRFGTKTPFHLYHRLVTETLST